MKKTNSRKNKHFFIFLIGFVTVVFLGFQSYINNQQHLAEVKYNYLVDQIKKERSDYWGLKSRIDVVVDKRLEKDKQLSSKFRKIDKEDVARIVFE